MTYVKAKKVKMGQVFREDIVIPVTLLSLDGTEGIEFKEGEKLKITGTSKGKGFQGVVKRHGFAGGPKTHGTKHTHRAPGSIGATGPQRVMPGVKMAGRMGGNTITIKNLEVVSFDKDRNLLMVKGAVPGNNGSALKVFTSAKAKKRG